MVFAALISPTAFDIVLLLVQAFVFSWLDSSQQIADWIWDATNSISLGLYACTLAWLMLRPPKRLPTLLLAVAGWLFSALGIRIVWVVDRLIENVYVNHLPGGAEFRELFASVLVCRLFLGNCRFDRTPENQSQLLDLLILIALAASGAYQLSVYEFNKWLFLQQAVSTILCGLFAFAATSVFVRVPKIGMLCASSLTACSAQAFLYFALLRYIYTYAGYDYDLVRANPWIFSIGLLVAPFLSLPILKRVGTLAE